MKTRRILYVTRLVRGGVEVVLEQLAKGLDRNQYEPVVLIDTSIHSDFRERLSNAYIEIIELKKYSENQTIKEPVIRKKKDIGERIEAALGRKVFQVYFSLRTLFDFFLKDLPQVKSYVKAIRENRIDLVHTHHDLRLSKPEVIASKICNVPCVGHRHAYLHYSYFDRVFIRFLKAVVYISKDVANHYYDQGELKTRGAIIHNGVDVKKFSKFDSEQVRKKEFKCKPDEILVGIIGRIDWWKGQEYFIEAIADIAKQKPSIRGIIIGGLKNRHIVHRMQYYNYLKSLIKSLDVQDNIEFLGYRNDVPRLISAMDVVVHASATPEPFGLVVIEAMAAKKPLVATAAGGVLDIVEDGVNGLLVPCQNSKAMAQAISKIISDPNKAKNMGLAAHQHVMSEFTLERQLTAVQTLYDFILK